MYLRTSDLAKAVGVHPNTVRLYEEWGFLPPIPRGPNGYRRFSQAHLQQMRLARLALCYPYPGGKGPVLALVKRAATSDLDGALEQATIYLAQIRAERAHAEAAAGMLEHWAERGAAVATGPFLTISQAAECLGTTPDTLRNWERNGLISVSRDPRNHYRLYGEEEIGRLRVIRLLRQAGYSMMAILRMLRHLNEGKRGDLRLVLDTPPPYEDVYSTADRWLSTLREKEQQAMAIIRQLEVMIERQQR